MNFKPNCAATIIGSFPHENADEACGLVFTTLPEIPAWPQLPRRSFLEEMNNQYSRRLPCFYLDEENRKSGFNTALDLASELERFYAPIIEDNVEYFSLDEDYAAGFHCFLSKAPAGITAVKGQVTGPLTLGLMTDVTDGKFALYKPDIFDAIVKNCAMAGDLGHAPSEIFSQLDNADLRFGNVIDDAGNTIELSHASFGSLMQHPNREVRLSAISQA